MFKLFKRSADTPPATPRRSAPARRADEDWASLFGPAARLRSAEENVVLSDGAVAWLASLPPHVRPERLAERFPRLVNRLALCWNDAVLSHKVLDELLIDTRGDRRGFPAAVAAELMRLREFHLRQFAVATDWEVRSVSVMDGESVFGGLKPR